MTALTGNPIPPAPPSADWLAQQIAAQEQAVNLVLAQMTATEIYQAYMREVGVLNKLREWQQAAQLQQQREQA